FALILRAARDLQRGHHGRSRGDADQETLFQRQAAGHVDGFVIGYGDDFIDVIAAEDAGHETAADSLNFVWPGRSAGEHGTIGRLDGNGFERRLLRLNVIADAGDGAAGTDSRDQVVDATFRILPDLGAGGFKVNLGI